MNINMGTSHPSAFISSTFIDLQEERMSVAKALTDTGLNVNALDIKPASANTSKAEIIRGIKESDFIILLIGDRYGSIMKEMTGSETRSITWWEYKIARMSGKPVIPYFKNIASDDFDSHDDRDAPSYRKKRIQFEKFKREISGKHNPAYFSGSSELYEKIKGILIPTYRDGVRDLTKKNKDKALEITSLKSEIERLKAASSNKPFGVKTETPNPLAGGLLGAGIDLHKPAELSNNGIAGLLKRDLDK